jgi:hypothetical protein
MYTRGSGMGELQVPDLYPIISMYQDLERRPPSVAVLVTGDGAGFDKGEGLGATLRDMYTAGWKVELIAWVHCVNRFIKQWVKSNGIFVPLDDFYLSITFLEPGPNGESARHPCALDFSKRPME